MAMPVEPPSPQFIGARFQGGAQVPHAIVIHGTVSPCADGGARAVAHDFVTTSVKKSAHYISDPNETIQFVGDHTVAFHCGFNQDTIGHELCDPQPRPDLDPGRWEDPAHAAMLEEAARIDAQLCLAFGSDIHRPSMTELKAKGPHGIYGHDDSRKAFGNTTHTDPGRTIPWHRYLALVRAKASELTQSVTPEPATGRRSARGVINHRVVTANLFVKNKAPLDGVAAITDQVETTFRRPPDAIGVQEAADRGRGADTYTAAPA